MARTQPARDPGFEARLNAAMYEARRRPAELARALKVHPTTMSRWRRGQIPDPRALTALAQELGVRVGWLKTGEGRRTEQVREPATPYAVSPSEMAFLDATRDLTGYAERGTLVPPAVAIGHLATLWNLCGATGAGLAKVDVDVAAKAFGDPGRENPPASDRLAPDTPPELPGKDQTG